MNTLKNSPPPKNWLVSTTSNTHVGGLAIAQIALRSVHGKFLSAQPDGSAQWNRDVASTWEYFHIEERPGGKITLKSSHGTYVSAQSDGSVQINREAAPPGGWEEFTVEDRGNDVVCFCLLYTSPSPRD